MSAQPPIPRRSRAGFVLARIGPFLPLLLCVAASADARAPWPNPEAQSAPSPIAIRIPMVTPAGQSLTLEAALYEPGDGKRHPAIIINHGSPREAKDRRAPSYGTYRGPARWFAEQGDVVVVPKRRGYGASDGEFVEGIGKCETGDQHRAGLTSANDVEAALRYTRGLPSVDPSRIVVLGQSAGGWAALALASRRPEGVIGIVNFAGGRGSLRDFFVCNEEGLVRAAGEYGRRTTIPSLWLYAANDRYLSPPLPRRMWEAFASQSKSATRLVDLPPFGSDGHMTFGSAAAAANWRPAVTEFLRSLE